MLISGTALLLLAAKSILPTQAAPLTTLQNSALSVPAASIVSLGFPSATNLVGSNLMLSAVMSGTFRGGRSSLRTSQRWLQCYSVPTTFQDGAAYAIVIRSDGSAIVSGPCSGPGTATDFATVCYASQGAPQWTNRYDGSGHGSDTSRLLAADPNGNVWVAGDSMRYATNSTLTDVVLIKYASNGIPVWTNRYSSFETNGAYPVGLAVDTEGNAYLQQMAAHWIGFSGTPVEDSIIKYDATGNVVWHKHYFTSALDSGQGLHGVGPMTLDDAGNLFVAGETGSEHYHTGDSIIKFASDGTAVWTNHHPAGLFWGFRLLSADRQGNMIATGENFDSGISYVVIKCSQAGNSLWTNRLAGPNYDGGNVPRTVTDPAGNVFVIGGSPGSSPGLYRILKVSSDGIPLWTNQNADFGVTNSMIEGAAADNAGNLYLVGFTPTANGERDWVTMKFSGDGQPLWTNRFNGVANREDIPSALAVSGTGEVYVTGRSEAQNGKRGFATIKYADLLFYSPPKDFTGVDTITCSATDYFGNCATGTVDVLVVPGAFQFNLAPLATKMTPLGMQLKIKGVPGTNTVVLESSQDSMLWQPILTNAPDNGAAQFLDPTAVTSPMRFYRAIQEQ